MRTDTLIDPTQRHKCKTKTKEQIKTLHHARCYLERFVNVRIRHSLSLLISVSDCGRFKLPSGRWLSLPLRSPPPPLSHFRTARFCALRLRNTACHEETKATSWQMTARVRQKRQLRQRWRHIRRHIGYQRGRARSPDCLVAWLDSVMDIRLKTLFILQTMPPSGQTWCVKVQQSLLLLSWVSATVLKLKIQILFAMLCQHEGSVAQAGDVLVAWYDTIGWKF